MENGNHGTILPKIVQYLIYQMMVLYLRSTPLNVSGEVQGPLQLHNCNYFEWDSFILEKEGENVVTMVSIYAR